MKREKGNKSLIIRNGEECPFCEKTRNSKWYKKAYEAESRYFRVLYRIFWLLFLPITLPVGIIQLFFILLCMISEKIEVLLGAFDYFFRKIAGEISLFIMNFYLRNSSVKERISLLDRKLRNHDILKRKRKYPDN